MNAQIGVMDSKLSNRSLNQDSGMATAPGAGQDADRPAAASSICWIGVRQYPYQPDHQVELLHLQAEADALLLHLKTLSQAQKIAQ
jgi:hypothetical protein